MPALEPLAPAMIEKPAGFLSLPRGLRDKVYAYLSSLEYNKQEYMFPWFVSLILSANPLPRL